LNRGSDERGALEAVERILNRGGDADVVLRAVLEALQSRGASSARVLFMEDGRLVERPALGGEPGGITAPVFYDGTEVGSLELGFGDIAFAERVATLIAPYVVRLDTSRDA
jgi:hypothetical protein